jgi:hypothetical protein
LGAGVHQEFMFTVWLSIIGITRTLNVHVAKGN